MKLWVSQTINFEFGQEINKAVFFFQVNHYDLQSADKCLLASQNQHSARNFGFLRWNTPYVNVI